MAEPTWTEWQIATLIEMWGQGASGQEIAMRIGKSKSACIAKAHRLKLPPHETVVKRRANAKPKKPSKGLTLDKLGAHDCHWPVSEDDEKPMRFCGEMIVPSKPYCLEHCRRAYRKPDQKDEAA